MPPQKKPLRRKKPSPEKETFAEANRKWFLGIHRKLENLETVLNNIMGDGDPEDDMPDWAAEFHVKGVQPFEHSLGIKSFRRNRTLTPQFVGRWLGSKVSIFLMWRGNCLWWRKLPIAQRAKILTRDGMENFGQIMRDFDVEVGQCFPKVENVRKKSFDLALSQPPLEQSQFFRGYSEGLEMSDRLGKWHREIKVDNDSTRLLRWITILYVMLCWREIEANRIAGGFPAMFAGFEEFAHEISEELFVDEGNFRRLLFRAGMRELGRIGRPKKQGQIKS